MNTNIGKKGYLSNLLLIFSGIIVALGITEIPLDLLVLSKKTDKYYVWKPNTEKVFKPHPDQMSGVSGLSSFHINSEGMRGDEFDNRYTYKILTVGGSTTICFYLDDSETWPYLIQQKLQSGNNYVFVGNVGKSGHQTRDHIHQIRILLEQYRSIDMVILLIGANDSGLRLQSDESFIPYDYNNADQTYIILEKAFAVSPGIQFYDFPSYYLPLYKKSGLYRLSRKAKNRFVKRGIIQDEGGYYYNWARRNRKNCKLIKNVLPDITDGLEEYSRNINTIIDIVQDKSVRLLMLTQPVLWDDSLPEKLEDLLWLGGVGGGGGMVGKADFYYSASVLSEAVDMYNKTLLNICKKREIECIDLASLLPKDKTVFYDDMHFNESGAKKVADIVSQYLLNHPPFND
jgi:lysophospholipase L1-like esterase